MIKSKDFTVVLKIWEHVPLMPLLPAPIPDGLFLIVPRLKIDFPIHF